MKEELLFQYNRVALESETHGISRITQDVAKMLQSYIGNVKGFLNDVLTPFQLTPRFDFARDPRLDRQISKTNYVTLGSVNVFVPAGMSVSWEIYLEALGTSQEVADRILDDVLKPAMAYFSLLLASPENLSSITHRLEVDRIIFHDKLIEQSKKAMAKCYSKHGVETKRPYGDVFKRNADWLATNAAMEALVERHSKVAPGEVSKAVGELTEVMERLIIRMRQSPEVYQVSGITSAALSKITLELGLEVEFYAAHCFMLQTAVAAMQDTVKHLNEVVKD